MPDIKTVSQRIKEYRDSKKFKKSEFDALCGLSNGYLNSVSSPDAYNIQRRFFEALDLLIETGRIKSLQAFCNEYELHRPKYSNIRTAINEPSKPGTGYKFIDIDALAYLVRDYGVSSEWLLEGKGSMIAWTPTLKACK